MSHPATTRCAHYVLGRRDMPCPVPGCPDGVPSPLFYTAAVVRPSVVEFTDSAVPPASQTVRAERWERSTLGVPGWGHPVDAWRKVDS